MRTGAIFARGSCRALKWVALVGAVVALAAGSVAAQTTVKVASVELEHADANGRVGEGVQTNLVITLDKAVPEVPDPNVTVQFQATVTFGGFDGTAGQAEAAEDVFVPLEAGGQGPVINGSLQPLVFSEGDRVFRMPLQTIADIDAVDEKFTITAELEAATLGTGTDQVTADATSVVREFTIVDDETQRYVAEVRGGANMAREGADFVVNFYAMPGRPDGDEVELYFRLESPRDDVLVHVTGASNPYMIDPGVGVEDFPLELTIRPETNDRNRDDHNITLMASMFDVTRGQSTDIEIEGSTITVLDIHHLPDADDVSAKLMDKATGGEEIDPAMIMEGETAYLVVTLANVAGDLVNDDETFTIEPMAPTANRSDVNITLDSASDEVTGSGMVTFAIEALEDDDINIDSSGMAIPEEIALVLDVTGNRGDGSVDPPAMFTISIEDMTDAQVEVAEGAYDHIMSAMPNPLNPGGMFSLETAMLFMFDEAMFDVSYGASVDGDAGVLAVSTSGDMVNIEAMGAGSAMVTVTATARPRASSFVVTQTVDNVAQVTFPVDVVLEDLSVMVMAERMEIMEGESAMLTATANRAVTEDTMIMLTVVGDEDAYMVADAIMIADGAMSGSVELMATEDDDYMNETLTVVATGPGIMGSTQVEVMVMDNDMAPTTVSAMSQEQVDMVFADAIGSDWTTEGDPAMVDMSMLFDVAEGAMPDYVGRSSDEMVVSVSSSGTMLTLMPMGAAGMATITVTARDAATGDVAEVMSDVMVMLEGLTYTVMADETNLVEGMEHENGTKTSAMVTVMASRELAGDETAEIMLMRDGSSSTATMDDYTVMPEMVTLMAGDMEATFTVMAVEDNMTEGGAGMPEMLTLFVSVNDMQMADKSVMFYVWDHAVPALPIVAQLLLAAFLALGGYRRYLRRR